jgi:monovalent cation:proton antiporter-2 (CPA2) family protein
METFLEFAFIYLVAAVVTVPLAKRFGLGAVLGYLVAGALIGPQMLRLVDGKASGVGSVAEFGVVMMLFLVGLELQPRLLWKMRAQLVGLGGLQVFGTALVLAGAGYALHLGWRVPVAVGLILAMSSTAIVLQSLQERGLFDTGAGQASFAVLLFQDVSVIPILAILPLLAVHPAGASAALHDGDGWLNHLSGGARAAVAIAAMVGVVVVGRYVVNPVFRAIASTRLRDLFTAAALLLVISVALLMHLLGLSPALGTFLAGVVLADSEFRHEMEADIEPFKGLLLGLFFMSVGSAIDFHLIATQPVRIVGLVLAFMAAKALVLFALGRVFKLSTPDRWLFALALCQGGEFAFVLLSFVVTQGVLSPAQAAPLVAAVAMSMAIAPLLFLLYAKVIAPRFAANKAARRADDPIHAEESGVIIAGFGRFGLVVGRMLQVNGFTATVLDLDPAQVDTIRKLGLKVFYGDATRLELLEAAGVSRARIFIIAIDNEDQSVALAGTLRRHYPHLRIMARAIGRIHTYRLMKVGVTEVYRETLDSSLSLAVDALRGLGMRGHQAWRAAKKFKVHDEQAVRSLAEFWDQEDETYFSETRRTIVALEQLFERDRGQTVGPDDAWDAPVPREK